MTEPTERARRLVEGAYDLHTHIDPDVIPRRIDDVALARRFAEVGLAGFALKSHYTSTAERARVVSGIVPEVRVFGTLTLNSAVGGLNPLAVEVAAREGALIVWLPTVDSPAETAGRREPQPGENVPLWASLQHELRGLGLSVEPVRVTDDDGAVLPALRDVLRAVARHDLVLATGHLARDDTFAVVDAAREEGVEAHRRHPPGVPVPGLLGRRPGGARRSRLPARARALDAVERQDDLGARLRRSACGGDRAFRLLERLRQPGVPAGRGRARPLGRPAACGRLRRGRGARARRRPVAAPRGGEGVSGRLLVIGAHSADFVWRAGGAIAVTTTNGGTAEVIALSYGERGESGELWKEPGQTVERVKEVRHGEAERAAAHLGARFRCLDLGDYPLEVDRAALERIADCIREVAPDVLLTHTDRDPFNPDHAVAFFAVERARALAAGAGVASAFATVRPPALYLFEPHQPELCNFTPTTFVDITPVIEQKQAAMGEMKAQAYLQTYYGQRAEQRGNHARRSSGDSAIRYAEAFQRVTPQVVGAL